MNKRKVGSEHEDMACRYLEERGYRILERNHRNRGGEIDIIARAPDMTLVFIEVKYRRDSGAGDPSEAVDHRKVRRISRAALWYLSRWRISTNSPMRFDVIAITGEDRIRHIINAFDYCP